MNKKKKRLIFLTLDPLNPVIQKLVKALSTNFEIIVVSDQHLSNDYPCQTIFYEHKPSILEKFLLLFYKPIESVQEKNFIQRNVYRKYKNFINLMFLLKKFIGAFIHLPTYSEINYFLFKNKKVEESIILPDDICIVDSNLRHTLTINPMVVRASRTANLISIVYSWDNPQYSTINTFSKAYLAINHQNKRELEDYHNIESDKIFITGSLIHDYLIEYGLPLDTTKNTSTSSFNNPIRIMYAAVFGSVDEIMIKEEVSFLTKLIDMLNKENINFEFIFRPYPSIVDKTVFDSLQKIPNLTMHEYKNFITIPHLGNKSVKISYSKNDEKINQFFDVDVLISAGSTYTLEFSFSDKSIIHLNANGFLETKDSSLFFERLSIYGHLNHLSPENYDHNVVNNFDEILKALRNKKLLGKTGYNNYLRKFSNPFYQDQKLARENIVSFINKYANQ